MTNIKKQVLDFLKDNPTATHKICLEAGLKVSESHFSRIRKSGRKMPRVAERVSGKRGYKKIDYTLVDQFLSQNSNGTFAQFKQEHPDFTISDAGFYGRRRENNGGSSQTRTNRPGLYMTLWSYDAEKLNDQARTVLTDLIETMNKSRRTNWQFIELKTPAVVEIRELSKR